MSNVIIYTRTSTKTQELGHCAQLDACRDWAEKNGHSVKAVFTDTVSGASELAKRPGFMAAINSLEAGDTLCVYRRDRLGRDVIINAVANKLISSKQATLRSLDVGSVDSAESMLLATLLDAISAYERSIIMARTQAALASKRDRGLCVGNVKLGERKVTGEDGRQYIKADKDEQAKVERIRGWRASGQTINEIVSRCITEGIQTRRGTPPTASTVSVWCKGITPAKPARKETEGPVRKSKAGRPTGTRGPRLEDRVSGLVSVVRLCLERGMSRQQITDELAKDPSFRTSKGTPISKSQVNRIVKRIGSDSHVSA